MNCENNLFEYICIYYVWFKRLSKVVSPQLTAFWSTYVSIVPELWTAIYWHISDHTVFTVILNGLNCKTILRKKQLTGDNLSPLPHLNENRHLSQGHSEHCQQSVLQHESLHYSSSTRGGHQVVINLTPGVYSVMLNVLNVSDRNRMNRPDISISVLYDTLQNVQI